MPPSLLPTKLPPNGNPPQGIEPYRPSPTKELTVEEKHAAWVERVRLMSEAVVTRSEHLRLQKELQSYQRLTQSRRFVEIPEEARVQMDAQSADVMRQCEEKKQALNAIVAQLTGADVWPAEPLGQRILDGSPAEMKASIIELKANVQHIFDALRKAAPTVGSDTKLVDTMDPQLSPHQGPPAKRRRLSPALNQLSLAVSSGDKAQLGSNALDEVMDLLRKFESRLSDLENDMIQHDNDLLEEVEGRIQNKLEGLQSDHSLPLLSSSEPGGQIQAVVAAEQQPALDVPQGRKLEEFRQEVDTLGEQVGELAQEVANLILEMRAKDEEAQRLRQDNELLMQEVDALKRQQQQNQDAIEESRQEIRALSAAVTAHLSHSADPPPIPQVPEMETIVAAVEPVVLQSVREDMKPLLDGMHTTIDNMLQDQKSQVYATVLSKMSTTIKTVEVVSDWMERIRKGEQSVERPDATDHDGNVQKNTDVSV
ncbi:hypothetical protein B0H21DRAFT_705064 [Amylocystis lapponica]|nr:hypothetical protein B0H21DRAFT_705064 [Amylocystis lapponica]